MVEFFQNCWQWLVMHKDEIVVFFTSSNFVAFISSIVLFVKQIKTNRASNTTNAELQQSLTGAIQAISEFESVKDMSNATNSRMEQLTDNVHKFETDISDRLNVILTKLNAVVDVQSIVYSTVKDESVRTTINGILTNAKFVEAKSKAELEAQIEELKAQLQEKVANITETVANITETVEVATENVKKTVSTTQQSGVSRY